MLLYLKLFSLIKENKASGIYLPPIFFFLSLGKEVLLVVIYFLKANIISKVTYKFASFFPLFRIILFLNLLSLVTYVYYYKKKEIFRNRYEGRAISLKLILRRDSISITLLLLAYCRLAARPSPWRALSR